MLPGGGIGPELMLHVREIFGKIGVPEKFTRYLQISKIYNNYKIFSYIFFCCFLLRYQSILKLLTSIRRVKATTILNMLSLQSNETELLLKVIVQMTKIIRLIGV